MGTILNGDGEKKKKSINSDTNTFTLTVFILIGDAVPESRFMNGSLNLNKLILRCDASSTQKLLKYRYWGLHIVGASQFLQGHLKLTKSNLELCGIQEQMLTDLRASSIGIASNFTFGFTFLGGR
jgi:hypothetical protein